MQRALKESVVDLNNDNQQKEYYITDVVEILNQKGYRIGAYMVADETEIMGGSIPEYSSQMKQ